MSGSTISNTVTHGIVLGTVTSGGTYASPLTITSSGGVTVSGAGDAIYGPATAAWTVVNQGSVVVAGAVGDGVDLKLGGSVDNSGLIESPTGVYVGGAAGIVTNSGTIQGTGALDTGIYLAAGGTIANGASNVASALISSAKYGVAVAGAAGTVSNFGIIQGTGDTYGVGIYLSAGGSISNAQGALISGMHAGVAVEGSTLGTVSNFGTIAGIGTVGYIDGVYINGSGAVVNGAPGLATALISGAKYGVVMYGTAASKVSNFGTIIGGGTGTVAIQGDGVGVYFKGLASVVNGAPDAASALISGVNYAIKMAGTAAGTVSNFGTIVSTISENLASHIYPDGIYIKGTGTIVNGATNATSALISAEHRGIYISGTQVNTVSNFGTIRGTSTYGTGVYLNAAGIVSNARSGLIAGADDGVVMQGTAASAVSNLGTITGGGCGSLGGSVYSFGVYIKGSGTVVNGATNGSPALIRGMYTGLGMELLKGPATVANFGTIIGGNGTTGQGVYVGDRGSVVNGALDVRSALISGGRVGIKISGLTGTVTNYGNVVATAPTGTGIYLSYGTVANFGTVTAGANGTGIYLFAGNVTNSGTIIAPSANAVVVRYGTFFNSGLVEGAVSGIELSLGTGTAGSGTVNVSGTVVGATGISVAPTVTAGQTVVVTGSVSGTGGTAVYLNAGVGDRLIVEPGAGFAGVLNGGSGGSVLEIAGSSGTAASRSGPGGGQGAVTSVTLGSVVNFSAAQIDPSATLDNSGVISFDTLVNQGWINVLSGASLALGAVASAANTGAIDLQGGGTIDFKGAVASQMVIFQPPGGMVVIEHADQFAATLSGFTATGDIVDLTHLAGGTIVGGGTLNGSDQLVVGNGAQSAVLQLDTSGDYSGVTWQTSADGGGTGTDVAPVCFCRGTMILTDKGEVAVEALALGDRVVTVSGAAKPITWIGFGRDLVTRRNSLARPIIVRTGALADNVPRRDLHLTHGHSLYLDGVLVPVEHLVNHRSILWDDAARVVEYYHIELDDHDVVLAEGAPAESYYDAGNRALFHNALRGSAAAATRPTCAPVLTGGETVERVWAELFARAGGRTDTDTTGDPDFHLVVDGKRLDPVSRDDSVYTFTLANPPAATLLLRSRSGVPSLLGTGRHDHRRLGVAIRQIIVRQPGVMTCLDHNAPAFAEGGCHHPESGHCWTDGEFALPAALLAHLRGAVTLLVQTSKQAMRYPASARVAAAA